MGEPAPIDPANPSASVRVDKWLWAVRVFKTRTLAADACRAGHVKLAGKNIKPSREVRPGDVIVARAGEIVRTVKVTAVLERRVGAKVAVDFMEDLTPESEYQKRREPRAAPLFTRQKGVGRPTKRDRRVLSELSRKVSETDEPPSTSD